MKKSQHEKSSKTNLSLNGKKKRSKKTRGILIAVIALLCVVSLLLIGGGIYVWTMFNRATYDGEASESFIDSLPPEDDESASVSEIIDESDIIETDAKTISEIPVQSNTKDITNILLLGIDSRGSYIGRSDTTMILTINSKQKTIKLTSILRDTMVTIPDRDRNGDGKDDYAKFNASYAYGGFDLLSKTILQNFRLKIDKYIAVNFAAFSTAVDAMDGVDMALTGAEAKIVHVGNTDNTYHLNGRQALTYSRIRYLDSDFGRTNRQRKMITALFGKAKSMGIGTLNSVLYNVLPHVRTNMSTGEFISFTANALNYFSYKMEDTHYLPQRGDYQGKLVRGLGAVLILNDSPTSVKKLHQFIYG